MSRPIVNTGGPGLVQAQAVRFAGIALIAGIVILLIFAALAGITKANGKDAVGGPYERMAPSSSMGAPAPQAT